MNDNPNTLEECLKELMRHIRIISNLQKTIDEKFGVNMVTGFIYKPGNYQTADINVRRGMEEIEKALGKKAEYSGYSRLTKELRHYGIEFRQFADDKTKTFVKAGCKPPKVVLVDEDDQEIQETK